MTNLIIADDHTVFREGLASFFKDEDEISVIAELGNGEEVLAMLPQLDVQIVLMDISMPKMDGIEASQMIKTKFPGVKIIMLTMHETQNYIRKLLDIGVDGYLLKTTSKSELFEAINTVLKGEKYYGTDVQKVFMNSFNSDKVSSDIKLTRREKEILDLICEELNTNEIADKLFISAYTVETHRKNLLSKTGSKNVAGLVKFAVQNKFV
ncbi:response regulator transcription factor [Crocinitomix catalasitica]|uniref:response regulator transcription factor n=1 Tax=Crocinitomix catalasitica TaxID=184607 RepID=UPI000488D0EF|nr:response regulator transcription factor [Crocinitomix catalasitica]